MIPWRTAMGSTENVLVKFKYFVLKTLNPISILSEEKKHKWYYYLAIPAFGWMLFFLQVGLSRNIQSDYPAGKIILLSATGLALGYLCVLAISMLLIILFLLWGIKTTPDKVISIIALSHTYMGFSMILGLVYGIFGNSSPTSFGIVGLLCTLLPIYSAIRILGKRNVFIAPVLASFTGILLLAGWQLILYINI
jgi:hypothetical protein